jgi:nitrite reductase/ring-hydroxylating ferredoxin subunit
MAYVRVMSCSEAPAGCVDRAGALPRPSLAAALASCPRGEVRAACHRGRDVAVAVRDDGSVVVVIDRCPHDGGPLSDGYLDGGVLVCPRHGWEFDLTTGASAGRPGHALELCPPPTRRPARRPELPGLQGNVDPPRGFR